MQEFHIKSLEEMSNLAKEIAKSCKKPTIFGLKGTLGAGKSFFAKEFINSKQENKTEILSPTFNIALEYEIINQEKIYHFDLYRIQNFDELENIGFFETVKFATCLVEWPEIAEKFLKKLKNYVEIEISITNNEERIVKISYLA